MVYIMTVKRELATTDIEMSLVLEHCVQTLARVDPAKKNNVMNE